MKLRRVVKIFFKREGDGHYLKEACLLEIALVSSSPVLTTADPLEQVKVISVTNKTPFVFCHI